MNAAFLGNDYRQPYDGSHQFHLAEGRNAAIGVLPIASGGSGQVRASNRPPQAHTYDVAQWPWWQAPCHSVINAIHFDLELNAGQGGAREGTASWARRRASLSASQCLSDF
jgi:hypothetical protein